MKIRINTSIASDRFSYAPGNYEVPDEIPEARAREFISAGWAQELKASAAPAAPIAAAGPAAPPASSRRR
jgi:hypothetical protein